MGRPRIAESVTKVSVRLPVSLRKRLTESARKSERTLSQEIRLALKRHLKSYEGGR